MVKKITSLNLETDDLEALRLRGIDNVSELARKAIKATLSDYFEDMEVFLKIGMVSDEIDRIDESLYKLNNQLSTLSNRRESLIEHKKKLEAEHIAVQRSTQLSSLIQKLNGLLVQNRFDAPTIYEIAPDIIKQIEEYNPNFNLDAHIERTKLILDI